MKLIEELQNVPDQLDKRTLYDEAVWIHDNRHVIARAVNENKSAETLREIAKLLNLQ